MPKFEAHFTNDAGVTISVRFTHRARLALEQDGIPYGKVAERILTADGLEKILLRGAEGFRVKNKIDGAPWTSESVRDFLDEAATLDVVKFLDGAYAAAMGGGKSDAKPAAPAAPEAPAAAGSAEGGKGPGGDAAAA